MEISPQTIEKPLTFRQSALFMSPFVAFVFFSLSEMSQISWLVVPILGLMGLMLGIAIWGLVKKLPLWALPCWGVVLGVLKLFTTGLVYAMPGLGRLKALLWTDSSASRVLYALIMAFLEVLPSVLLLGGLALLVAWMPALAGWRRRLKQDWTLLPLLLYVANLWAPAYADAYRGMAPYEVAFTLILAAGIWPYLRAARPRVRMIMLLAATLLAGGVLAFSIYQLYPLQTWAQSTFTTFPRWWETLMPLLNTLALLVALCVLALFGARMRCKEAAS